MAITDVRLQNFRTYTDSAFDLGAGVNIIVGPNTSGKTNLLEALLFLASGKSYRAKADEVVGFDSQWARLDAHTKNDGTRTVKISKTTNSAIKEFEINQKAYKILTLAHTIPTVLFEPNHLLTLTGLPDLRRDFLDELLEQTETGYSVVRRDYKRALRQRNRLLKSGPGGGTKQLFAWDIKLSQLASVVTKSRSELSANLDKKIKSLYKKLSNSRRNVDVKYNTQIPVPNYGSDLLKKLEQSTDMDFARGFTGYGPHRDDLAFYVNGHNIIESASRGEVRTIVLALKILELDILEAQTGRKPILLLDDVFSELDGARRKALTGYIKDYQTFITTTDADLVVHNFAQKCHIIPLV